MMKKYRARWILSEYIQCQKKTGNVADIWVNSAYFYLCMPKYIYELV